MTSRSHSLILGFLLAISAILAGLWMQAHRRQNALEQMRANRQADWEKASRQSDEEKNVIGGLNAEIATQKTILENAPSSLEARRRTATLALIDQIKIARQKNPPAPRQKAPPSGPSGFYFPELLADPEYNRLYALENLETVRRSQGTKVARLGLPPDVSEKIIAALAEKEMAFADLRSLTDRSGYPGSLAQQQTDLTNVKLLELMGREAYAHWKNLTEEISVTTVSADGKVTNSQGMPSHEALVDQANTSVIPKLAVRLSYTGAPLQKEQASRLADILADCSAAMHSHPYQVMTSDTFIQQAAEVLPAAQLQALQEFQAEQQANLKRSKLPKSSELPRNAPVGK